MEPSTFIKVSQNTFQLEDATSPTAFLRNDDCEECWLKTTYQRCIMGTGPKNARMMIVLPYPSENETYRGRLGHAEGANFLYTLLALLDIDPERIYITSAVKCTPENSTASNKKKLLKQSVKECAHYLDDEIETVDPDIILSVGAEPFLYFKHREGVGKNRGQMFDWQHPTTEKTYRVMPTVAPMAVKLNPKHFNAFQSDIMTWYRVATDNIDTPEVHIKEVTCIDEFNEAMLHLRNSALHGNMITFDLETRGFQSERPDYSRVWGIAITDGLREDKQVTVWSIPIEHPEAPWYKDDPETGEVVDELCTLILDEAKVNGHNLKFDLRWMQGLRERWA